MLFMVIEHFHDADPVAVHERFAQRGRMLPDGVIYHASWIDSARARCFQVMEAADAGMLAPWIQRWADLMEFEVVPVVPSAEYWATLDTDAR
ncbi:MAG TPA: DUF3303 family protein [Vicinamibacterales bacterium]|jgi:hypothetical protein